MHITPTITEQVDILLKKKQDSKLKTYLLSLDNSDIAHIIDQLPHGKRKVFSRLTPEKQADVALMIDPQSRMSILPRIGDESLAGFLLFLSEDDVVDLLHDIPDTRVAHILSFFSKEKRSKVEKLRTFGHETAGGLMDFNFCLVDGTDSLAMVAVKVNEYTKIHKRAPLPIVQSQQEILGYLSYKSIVSTPPAKKAEVVCTPLPVVAATLDQEQVLRIAMRERSEAIAVHDDAGMIIGVIHLQDLLPVAQNEATEDLYLFAGVDDEEDALDSPLMAVNHRYRWLLINLATAFLAAFVVSFFEHTISVLPVLAAYMPIVAGMGGNTGTQSLAVVIRGLALGQIHPHQKMRVIVKEALAGMANGILNGLVVTFIIWVSTGQVHIGLILCLSMIINLTVAGIFGALVPITLKACKIDPAVASTVFVTTATDVFGFFTFLGLATWLLV